MASFQTMTIQEIIDDLNYSYLLPAIQREFVWESKQMLDLFDSIVREYPIGSFLFWKVSGDYAQSRTKYKFVEDYIEEPIYPDEIEGVTYHNERYKDEFNNPPDKVNLVLDGQQRLSTLHIGLKGTITTRGYMKKRDRPESWTQKQLYLNLLSPPSEEINGRKYEFQFKKPEPPTNRSEYWYRVGDILDVSDAPEEVEKVMDEIQEIDGITVDEVNEKRKVVNRNLNNLHMAICKSEIIPYFTETEESQDKVLDIFIRTNEGGTQLSKSDVLLSIATSHWKDGEDGIVAREKIKKFVDRLNQHDARGGVTFSPNFVLRSLLLCSGSSQLSFTLDNFDDKTLEEMKSTWLDDGFQTSCVKTLDLLTSFGFTTSHVQSKMTLLPILHFIYQHNPSLSWDSNTGQKNRKRILYWISSMVVTGEMNTGGTVQTIQSIRHNIMDADGEFPITEIEKTLNNFNKSMGFDREKLDRWFGTNSPSLKKSRVFLSLIYFPSIADNHQQYEVDHIFPKSILDKNNLIDEHGFSAERADEVSKLANSAANLQLIRKRENRQKEAKQPVEWIKSRSKEYKRRHLIPENENFLKLENIEEFFERRRTMMKDDLVGKTPDRPSIEMAIGSSK